MIEIDEQGCFLTWFNNGIVWTEEFSYHGDRYPIME